MAPEKDLQIAIDLAARVGRILHGLERSLPGRASFDVTLMFRRISAQRFEELAATAEKHGYRVVPGSFSFSFDDNHPVWRFCVVALHRSRSTSPALLAHQVRLDEDSAVAWTQVVETLANGEQQVNAEVLRALDFARAAVARRGAGHDEARSRLTLVGGSGA
jgi:hypothetical protein